MNNFTKKLVNEYYNVSDNRISIVTNGTDLKKFYNSRENNHFLTKQQIFKLLRNKF